MYFTEVPESGGIAVSIARKFPAGPKGPLLLPSRTEPQSHSAPGHFPDDSADLFAGLRNPLRVPPAILRFGPFEASLERRELRKHGMKIRLEGKPFDILDALLREPGQLITREMLRAKLWPGTFVSYEHCLNTAVNKLRVAVGDSAQSFRFIETVRGRGYRFIGQLEHMEPGSPAHVRRAVLLVLPLRSHGPNRAVDSFATGLTDEMSARLGQLDPERLAMVPVSVAFLCGRMESNVKEIGQKVGADLVLEGSVRHAGGRVRVTLQLARVLDQLCIWSEIYERPITPPLAYQAEIAQLVASSIASEFGLGDFRVHPRPNPSALAQPHPRMEKIGSWRSASGRGFRR